MWNKCRNSYKTAYFPFSLAVTYNAMGKNLTSRIPSNAYTMAERLCKKKRDRNREQSSRSDRGIVDGRRVYPRRIVEEGRCRKPREQASKAMSQLSDVQIDGQGRRNERGIGMDGWREIWGGVEEKRRRSFRFSARCQIENRCFAFDSTARHAARQGLSFSLKRKKEKIIHRSVCQRIATASSGVCIVIFPRKLIRERRKARASTSREAFHFSPYKKEDRYTIPQFYILAEKISPCCCEGSNFPLCAPRVIILCAVMRAYAFTLHTYLAAISMRALIDLIKASFFL